MRFLLESSSVPIYERINLALKNALEQHGHEVLFFSTDFPDDEHFISTVNGIPFDFYLASNEGNRIHSYLEKKDKFIFELVKGKIIFLFQDNVFCGTGNRSRLEKRYQALASVNERSNTFVIERSNLVDLKELGIQNITLLPHATEFRHNNTNSKLKEISFIGHTMSGLQSFPLDAFTEGRMLIRYAWMRYANLGKKLQPEIDSECDSKEFKRKFIDRQYHLNLINKMTFSLRGEILQALKLPVTIYGGDLSYGRGDASIYKSNSDLIRYKPATLDYKDASSIYSSSEININITGMQFDTAINNRVFDVIASGGVILTDYKEDFVNLFPYAEALTYKNADDLRSKINAAKEPAVAAQMRELCSLIQHEVLNKFSYKSLITKILANL